VENKMNMDEYIVQLSKGEREIVQNIKSFKIVAIGVMLLGMGGIGLGIYSIWFRPMTSDAKQIVLSLFGYSIGFIIMGWLLNKMCKIIQKINKFYKSRE